ncbi:MAG: hypothetical protein ACK5L3_11580 [Oscillospiraceae bacterium]
MAVWKTRIKQLFARPKAVLLLCYAVFLAAWLLWQLFCLGYDKAYSAEVQLAVGTAAIEGLESLPPLSGGLYLSTGEDPQIIFTQLNTPLRRVVLQCRFPSPPGEVALYYMRPGEAAFSAGQRVFGRLLGNGSYEFVLPPGRVAALRVDPGNQSGMTMQLDGVVLNPAVSVWRYFLPGLRGLLAFALLPALACCAIYTIIEVFPAFLGRARRR